MQKHCGEGRAQTGQKALARTVARRLPRTLLACRLPRTLTASIFACVLVLTCALCLVLAPAAWAEGETNVVGATITVTDPEHPEQGKLTFQVTYAAPSASTPGAVRLTDATEWVGDLTLGQIESNGYLFNVAAVGANAFKNNTALASVEFTSNLVGTTLLSGRSVESNPGIGANAFESCTSLTRVTLPQKTTGIGAAAFKGCTSLSTVAFAQGAQIYIPSTVASNTPAIGANAFEGCTSLKAITIPAITSTQRTPDYYEDYSGPAANTMWSGYFTRFGPGNNMPVYRQAFGGSAFKDCTALESVAFEPSGSPWNLFAYFIPDATSPVFQGCTNLKSVVFASEQPYYADPDRSLSPGGYSPAYRNIFDDAVVAPTLYYAVNYYATDDEALASGDVASAGKRSARVVYQRNTPVAALATSDEQVLAGLVYADGGAFGSDIPNPQAAAVAANLDPSKQWIWKLGGTQSRRAGLADSCYAYLAPAEDIAAGRVGGAPISTMYKLSGQNLSRGHEPVTDSPFDVVRYYSPSTTYGTYVFSEGPNFKLALNEGETAWFTLDSSVEQAFFDRITVCAPDGTLLDPSSYEVSFERYDTTDKLLVPATLGDEQDGPLLMTIKPNEQSGYTGVLQEWVLVKGQSGSVRENYTTSPTATLAAATHYNGGTAIVNTSPYTGPYAVAIGSADLPSALVASAYAGLVSAPISVRDTTDAAYGFDLAPEFSKSGVIVDKDLVSFPAVSFSSPSGFAVAAYEAFESTQRTKVGAAAYPWGDTAVLVPAASLEDVAGAAAAYAYAKAAPVFFTEEDGTVSDDTLNCLKGFAKVAVIGGSTQFSPAAFDALKTQVAGLRRISGDVGSAGSLSLAVAELLISEGTLSNYSVVTITDAADSIDAIVALSLSGHEGGLALVSASTADSKLISAFLHEKRDTVRTVRLFGRGNTHMSSEVFDALGSLGSLWKNSGTVAPIGQGDTLVLYGLQLEIGAGNELTYNDVRLWGSVGLVAGNYTYNGVVYQLKDAIQGTDDLPVDPDPEDPEDPLDPEDPEDPKDPDTTTKPPASTDDTTNNTNTGGGSLNVTTPVVSTPQQNSSATSTGSLVVAPFTVEDKQSSDASADEKDAATLDDTPAPLATGTGLQERITADQQNTTPPEATAAVLGSTVSALGGALWFALRRRKEPALALDETAGITRTEQDTATGTEEEQ